MESELFRVGWFHQAELEMPRNELPNDIDTLLADLERLPVDVLEIVQAFVAELIRCGDDDDPRKAALQPRAFPLCDQSEGRGWAGIATT